MILNSLRTRRIVINLSRTIRSQLFKIYVIGMPVAIPSNNRRQSRIVYRYNGRWNNPNLNRIKLKLIKHLLHRKIQRSMIKNITNLVTIDRPKGTLSGNLNSILGIRLYYKTCRIALLHCTCKLSVKASPLPSETERHGVRAGVSAAAEETCHLRRSGRGTLCVCPCARSQVILGSLALGTHGHSRFSSPLASFPLLAHSGLGGVSEGPPPAASPL